VRIWQVEKILFLVRENLFSEMDVKKTIVSSIEENPFVKHEA